MATSLARNGIAGTAWSIALACHEHIFGLLCFLHLRQVEVNASSSQSYFFRDWC
jgi:hypothetical protein